MLNKDLLYYFSALEINQEQIETATVRNVMAAFRKLASKLHPDKAGDESTAAFQELLNSCNLLREYLKEERCESDSFENQDCYDDDEKFFDDNFEEFNFPFENKGSFTVAIEDYLADT